MRGKVRVALRVWLAMLWPVTLVGMIIGAAVGAVLFAPPVSTLATTTVRVDRPVDSDVIMTKTQPFPDGQTDFLGGQMAYLKSAGYLDAVAQALGQSTQPAVSAALLGKSNLIEISATGASEADARRVDDAAVKTYVDRIGQIEHDRNQAALDAVVNVIIQIETSMKALGQPLDNPPSALVALYLQRSALQVQLARAPSITVVSSSFDQVPQGQLPVSVVAAIGGTFLGGLIALTAALVWRARRGVLIVPGQIDCALVLMPVLSTHADKLVNVATGRALFAQLPVAGETNVVVLGTSPISGNATVAACLSTVVDELAVATDGDLRSFSGPNVVDAGCLVDAPGAVATMEDATQVVVVVRLGCDTMRDLEATVRAARNRDVPVSVICTRGWWIESATA